MNKIYEFINNTKREIKYRELVQYVVKDEDTFKKFQKNFIHYKWVLENHNKEYKKRL